MCECKTLAKRDTEEESDKVKRQNNALCVSVVEALSARVVAEGIGIV